MARALRLPRRVSVAPFAASIALTTLVSATTFVARPTVAYAQTTAPTTAPAPSATPGPGAPATSAVDGPKVDAKAAAPAPAPTSAPALSAPPASSASAGSSLGARLGALDPAKDESALVKQGADRPTGDGTLGARTSDVYSEDWWGRPRPILELHGYFRVRGELLHNFALGRHDVPTDPNYPNLWAQPVDNSFTTTSGTDKSVLLCDTPDRKCQNSSQAGANMRFRVTPELHISDNLRILTQIDALDNIVLGSTADSMAAVGSPTSTGYSATSSANPIAQTAWQSSTQGPPTSGINNIRNSIDVKRAWAEYATPLGQVRFGRMPFHWGLGMLYNAGDTIDSDWQSTVDRIQIVSGLKSLDLYAGGSWDFANSGPTSGTPYDVYGGVPYSVANLVNVNQWSLFVAKRKNPELTRLALSRGDIVINAGALALYRSQFLDVDSTKFGLPNQVNNGLVRTSAAVFSPDLWVQLLWRSFRFEAELASHIGSIDDGKLAGIEAIKVRQYGFTTQTEFRAIDDRLRLNFGFGWASGDPAARTLSPGPSIDSFRGRAPISTFRYHPDYRVDLIFFRRILQRVEGAYYFRPSVDYDFIRKSDGQKFGGGAAVIWSRASEFVQTPGHKRDLGVELDLQLYYQAKDGALNDDPTKLGGFYTMLQYGVFFPLGGLSYLPGEQTTALPNWDTSAAQTVRLFLGVAY
ncbi:MAG: TIGR04551 family protein [Polyangiaceae bacterium]